jgi:putative membrane protein
MSDGDGERKPKQELAKERTDWAEDRTILANERTYAGWFRTGFASAAIGLGFNALFVQMQPWWAPRAIASIFLLLAVFIFVSAERRACKVLGRLSTHEIKAFGTSRLRIMTASASIGAIALLAAMWLLPIEPSG